MMNIMNELYISDLKSIAEDINIPWTKLQNKSILITGATGLIGSFLVDLLMYRNNYYNNNIKVLAMNRSVNTAKARFSWYLPNTNFVIVEGDVCQPLRISSTIDYIIHGASNADPLTYSSDPVGTMKTNFIGTYNLLEYARNFNVTRSLFISTVEIYGEGNNDVDSFDEDYCGYINCIDARACYPESKRAAEALCASYKKQYNVDALVSRLCYIYGPTMTQKDSKVIAQFIRNAIKCENIVMKSEGLQLRSYCYVADAVSALLYILLLGKSGNAYNVANRSSNVTIRQIAETLSELYNLNIVFELPDILEKGGYSKTTKAVLNAKKLEELGWSAKIDLKEGLQKTVSILKS